MARTQRDVLNHLIAVCRDGARGFRLAADHTVTPHLKRVFDEASFQRQVFAEELVPFAERLGGQTTPAGTPAGTLHRGWMKFKDAVAHYDEPLILAEAIRGEREAGDAYADAVMSFLPPEAREVIEQQYSAVLATQRELDRLADLKPVATSQ
jgi:uncharacterized protein (TIGR02284 family)